VGWQWLAWLTLALLLLALAGAILLLLRAHGLGRVVGSFECAWRPAGRSNWTSGVACYGVGRLDWYRLISLRPGPARRWGRGQLVIEGVEPLPGASSTAREVHCRIGGEEFYLAVDRQALAGLAGWLESLPPTNRGLA